MCGRYYLSIDLGNLSFVDNLNDFKFDENFNIAPQSSVPAIIDNKLVECTWGYYPQWLKVKVIQNHYLIQGLSRY